MVTTVKAPALHTDSLECWCQPEAVPAGTIAGPTGLMQVMKLVHNDLLGWHLGLWAASRFYDAHLEQM